MLFPGWAEFDAVRFLELRTKSLDPLLAQWRAWKYKPGTVNPWTNRLLGLALRACLRHV